MNKTLTTSMILGLTFQISILMQEKNGQKLTMSIKVGEKTELPLPIPINQILV